MSVRLIESLATTPELAEVFSDESVVQAMLDFEAALARAEAAAGIIPLAAAEAICLVARAQHFAVGALAAPALRAGTLSIPLVKALIERVRAADSSSAAFVHWGATSQDVADTAMVLLVQRAGVTLARDHARLRTALRKVSDDHSHDVMLGRTLLQPAPPVTFGLKAAGWYAALERSWAHAAAAWEQCRILQFGGASGTLAAFGESGIAVSRALADDLGLRLPPAPWHTHRDVFATLICACGVYCGSLAKMARDISLLTQSEVAEAFEAGGPGRGGSSTMPHKRNPVACAIALAAGGRLPGLAAAFLSGMAQEHERAVGSWQAEWPLIAGAIEGTHVALASMLEVAEGLRVDPERMRSNIEATRGVIFAERAMLLLAGKLGREQAHHTIEEAVRLTEQSGRTLVDVLADLGILPAGQIAGLDSAQAYLGSAETFRKRLLGE
jgi:3-carboxy-cis,cis-muconate cycloisomerase